MKLKKGDTFKIRTHADISLKLFNKTMSSGGCSAKLGSDLIAWFIQFDTNNEGWNNKIVNDCIYENLNGKNRMQIDYTKRITFSYDTKNYDKRTYKFEGLFEYSKKDSDSNNACYKLVASEIDTDKYKC